MQLGSWHRLQSLPGAPTLLCAGVALPYRSLPTCLVLVSTLEWQTQVGGYCRETGGENLDELSMLVALKQKRQTNEMIQNWGWSSHTACVPNSPSTDQPHAPDEVAQCLLYEMAGGRALPHRIGDRIRQGNRCGLLAQCWDSVSPGHRWPYHGAWGWGLISGKLPFEFWPFTCLDF